MKIQETNQSRAAVGTTYNLPHIPSPLDIENSCSGKTLSKRATGKWKFSESLHEVDLLLPTLTRKAKKFTIISPTLPTSVLDGLRVAKGNAE